MSDDGDSTLIVVRAAAGRVVEIRLPASIWEWFLTVREPDGTEAFSDWDEVFSDLGETPDELTALSRAAAGRLMRAVAGAELRVVPRPGVRVFGMEWMKGRALEIRRDGTWVRCEEVLYPAGAVDAQLESLRQHPPKGAG